MSSPDQTLRYRCHRFKRLCTDKSVSRDTRIKTWIQVFKYAVLTKFGMKGSALFLALYNTKPGESSPHLHFAKAKKIVKVAPVFLKLVEGNEEETWFKMQ